MSDKIGNIASKSRGWPKGKKRKKLLKDENGPGKKSGYIWFMKQRRETLSKENIGMPFAEITKIVGEEWSSMSSDQKAIFFEKAEKHKETLKDSKLKPNDQNEPNKKYAKVSQSTSNPYNNRSKLEKKTSLSKIFDDPIFTESFLDYNKAKESELHQLNRTNAEYEQHNCIIEKHVDNLKNAIIKLESENHQQTIKNKGLESKLLYFRELLCLAFSDIPLPSSKELPTVQTIDTYLAEICNILEKNNDKNVDFASMLYDAMTTVSFQSLDAYWDDHKIDFDS